ncbi:CDP-diacylglycerol--glycerol-3-phosphate 3-phosphatidyltransferase [Candidatus Omnitrophota bacterium]
MGLANKITIVRILLVPFLLASLIYYSSANDYLRYIALAIFLACGLTDAIDGYIARKFYQKTKLGKMLDPLADKILILTAFLSLSILENIPAASRIPPWLTVIVFSRDIIILLGSLLIFIMSKELNVKPSILGKLTTVLQMAAVVAALLGLDSRVLIWHVTAFLTIASGLGYVWYGTKELNEPR